MLATCPTNPPFSSSTPASAASRCCAKSSRYDPDAAYTYVADDAFFPYGQHTEGEIIARVVPLIGELIAAHKPDLAVIACNTASTLVMTHLRYAIPFIGTVPAIKPACAASRTKRVSVLGTRGTVRREYTKALIRISPATAKPRWSAPNIWPRWPKRRCAARVSATRRSQPRSRPALRAAAMPRTAPTRWYWPAHITRCCWSRSGGWPPGR
ncbi:aspartate/glutamate racemase family protein [Streptomyces canarius]